MSVLDRVLLALLAAWAIFASVMGVLFGTGTVSSVNITFWSQNPRDELYIVVISLVFALIGARFLVYRLGRVDPEFVVLPGEHGHIRISFTTFQQLANATGQTIRGVESFETRVRHGQTGILLAVRVRVHKDIDIAGTSNDVQIAVKEHIERTTGVTVERITVNVTEIANTGAKSSKAWAE